MTKKQEENKTDFFDEVQNKIEKDIFLGKEDQEETSMDGRSGQRLSSEEIDISSLNIEIEIVDPDSDSSIIDLDESFLEEVEMIQEVEEKDETAVQCTPSDLFTEDTSGMDSVGRDVFDPMGKTDDLQEDDRYLGEMISREMAIEGSDRDHDIDLAGKPSYGNIPPSSEQKYDDPEDQTEILTPTLGELYAEQGHYDKAVEIYENILQDEPWNRKYQQRLDELRKAMMGAPVHENEEEEVQNGTPVETLSESRTTVIQHLENWLERIRNEKERRCLKNS